MAQTPRKLQERVVVGRNQVLGELHAGGPRSRLEIRQSLQQAHIDHSPDTIEQRLHELREEGLIRLDTAERVGIRAGLCVARSGRPRQYATLSDAWGLGLGLEIGRSKIRAAALTPAGVKLASSSCRRFPQDLKRTFTAASGQLANVLEALSAEQHERLLGLVVAVSAPVNRRTREGASNSFPAEGRGPLDELLAEQLGVRTIPVVVVNDAVARAIAEGRFGLARASQSAFV